MTERYDGPERRRDWPPKEDRFHFEKSISIGHVITTITIAVTAIMYAANIEKRVALLEANDKFFSETLKTTIAQHALERQEILQQLGEIKTDVRRIIVAEKK